MNNSTNKYVRNSSANPAISIQYQGWNFTSLLIYQIPFATSIQTSTSLHNLTCPTCCLLEIRQDIHLSILPIYIRHRTAKKQTAHLSTMKVYFDKMIVGDLLSYNPTFLQITRIALYMYTPVDNIHLKLIAFVEHFEISFSVGISFLSSVL